MRSVVGVYLFKSNKASIELLPGRKLVPDAWLLALAICVLLLSGCTPRLHTISPYSEDEVRAAALEASAMDLCRAKRSGSTLPLSAFKTDGCTMYPDEPWLECCIRHDKNYWCGGSRPDRKESDRALKRCVAEMGFPWSGRVMYLGARLGGHPWLPLPWRWGYGWKWPSGHNGSGRDDEAGRREE